MVVASMEASHTGSVRSARPHCPAPEAASRYHRETQRVPHSLPSAQLADSRVESGMNNTEVSLPSALVTLPSVELTKPPSAS